MLYIDVTLPVTIGESFTTISKMNHRIKINCLFSTFYTTAGAKPFAMNKLRGIYSQTEGKRLCTMISIVLYTEMLF